MAREVAGWTSRRTSIREHLIFTRGVCWLEVRTVWLGKSNGLILLFNVIFFVKLFCFNSGKRLNFLCRGYLNIRWKQDSTTFFHGMVR